MTEDDCVSDLRRASDLRRVWAEWLAEYNWDHAVTLTTRFAWGRAKLEREFVQRFIRRLARMAQRSVPYFCIIEEATPGHPHAHALLAGSRDLSIEQIRRAWDGGLSDCTILREPAAALAYVTKHIDRKPDDYLVSTGWIPRTSLCSEGDLRGRPKRRPRSDP